MTTLGEDVEEHQIQFQPEVPFLNKNPLMNKINRIARKNGLEKCKVTEETAEFVSQAVQIYMRGVVEHLIKISKLRIHQEDDDMIEKKSIERVKSSDAAMRMYARETERRTQLEARTRVRNEEEAKRQQQEKDKEDEKARKKKNQRRQQEEDERLRTANANAAAEMAIAGITSGVTSSRQRRREKEKQEKEEEEARSVLGKRRRDDEDKQKVITNDLMFYLEHNPAFCKSHTLYNLSSRMK
jgi:type IV secretory pathway VirB10-like protein